MKTFKNYVKESDMEGHAENPKYARIICEEWSNIDKTIDFPPIMEFLNEDDIFEVDSDDPMRGQWGWSVM